MSELPEDRGPDSVRRVKYNPSNPIHQGIMRTREVNSHIDRPAARDTNPHITMSVKRGMEEEPKLSGRYMTNEETAGYVVPAKDRVKLPKAKPVIKTDAPSMKETKDAGAIYKKTSAVAGKKSRAEEQVEIQKKIAARLAANRKPK
jgi:hypothetical protein